ncbi:MAG: bifunctional phosphopantothenoylcysteine decarboxylase/phosphopantothenate--cysteine ligase CoaBC [Desulfobulbaceae bacterium]|nr:bifunctional phosphopantothenoylcysteine decarboxylase/phosphopantothenate--cysteine ligase CoaBC [Desulfobulbaceae bacterium]HIJ78029.1 bifunctional phosphopantothenoylcysteine decarboxylase/phosphopantothenate--cysteine ligase CoaBC [Deltaproteobacteria bacterium]
MTQLADKKILLGITGSISAYKAADWVRALRKEGGTVTVVMTESATKFISPLTMAALSGNRVYHHMFKDDEPEKIPHINLAREHDLNLIAPATAQTIGRLAHGLTDDLLSAIILASSAPTVVCPAMNSKMYLHPATQTNIATLKTYGYHLVDPDNGTMACGEEGPGRLTEWPVARQTILKVLAKQDLAGESILITAGPTREPFDPVRFLSNRSSGKMGYALAEAASQRGARVTLVSGPTTLPAPAGVELIAITSAQQMHREVMARVGEMSVVIKAAAVSDYRPASTYDHKVKKGQPSLQFELIANPDILKELGQDKKNSGCVTPLLVGFAAESQNHLEEGSRKLREKNLDMIVINDIGGANTGFEVDTNRVTMIDRNNGREELPLLSKEETAHRILDRLLQLMEGKR